MSDIDHQVFKIQFCKVSQANTQTGPFVWFGLSQHLKQKSGSGAWVARFDFNSMHWGHATIPSKHVTSFVEQMRQNQNINLGPEWSNLKAYCTLHQTEHSRYIFSIVRKVLAAQKQRGGFTFDIYASLICGRVCFRPCCCVRVKNTVVRSMVRPARQWWASGCRHKVKQIYMTQI